jgi:SAM-dependent methyltransferase
MSGVLSMVNAEEHYARHLAPIYVWMAGGFDAAVARGEAEMAALLGAHASGATAVDLGAGFGMHAIPLARRGYSVLAVDSSLMLLELMKEHARTLSIRSVADDLLAFREHLDTPADLILCMGDTLTHLPDLDCVDGLFSSVTGALRPDGQFIASFRDYTIPLAGDGRFIPVRSDSDRILTCFLEYSGEHVTVNDLLHERQGQNWGMRISSYRKLRISPEWAAATLRSKGFVVRLEPGLAGMTRLIAKRE